MITRPRSEAKPFVFALKPEYAKAIINGSKGWEVRTRMPSVEIGDLALIYESRGRGRIVGSFRVTDVIHPMRPVDLWDLIETLGGRHGVAREDFNLYFQGRSKAIALGVGSPVKLDPPLPLPPGMAAPQSWARLRIGEWNHWSLAYDDEAKAWRSDPQEVSETCPVCHLMSEHADGCERGE